MFYLRRNYSSFGLSYFIAGIPFGLSLSSLTLILPEVIDLNKKLCSISNGTEN